MVVQAGQDRLAFLAGIISDQEEGQSSKVTSSLLFDPSFALSKMYTNVSVFL